MTAKLSRVAQRLNPLRALERHRVGRRRKMADHYLANFAKRTEARWSGPVLIDGMWDNPNYWIRLSLLRRTLGLPYGNEMGYLGPYKKSQVASTFGRLGIRTVIDAESRAGDMAKHCVYARQLLASATTAADLLQWKLPYDFPAMIAYDAYLKRQRSAAVNLADPLLPELVAESLAWIEAGQRIVSEASPSLVLVTHAVDYKYAAIAWAALQRGIPVVLMFGNYGVPRFVKLRRTADIYETVDCPRKADLDGLSGEQRQVVMDAGERYLTRRRAGGTDDIGGLYAYQRSRITVDRAAIAREFGWDPTKPMIGVYASNWFDYPHAFGMTSYRDFLEWLEETLAIAKETTSVNWIFRPHPIDEWYGGVTLRNLMPAVPAPHVRLVPAGWNGNALFGALDGVVTFHGTVGIEFAGEGKPVLLADRGWYHELGFAIYPKSRDEYRSYLRKNWWTQIDLEQARTQALSFAGLYFCRPSWQAGLVLRDDSVQDLIYSDLPDLLEKNEAEVSREIETLRSWFASDHPSYHTYKMLQTNSYAS